jgi:carnitine 3-dehydrogenase
VLERKPDDASADRIERIAIVGAGVIGTGWAARCLANGLNVVATDPAVRAEERLRAGVANAWPALEKIGLAKGAEPERLEFCAKLEAAVSRADFILEAAPENEDIKRKLIAEIDANAAPHIVIASSSSGLLPSRIQADCRHPERVLIGHPFHPVYVLPILEIVGGEKTGAAAIRSAEAFFRSIGMRPLRLRTEIEGYLGNRIQEAVWREALHLLADGVATTAEIDAAVRLGPGLRWGFMGPFLTFHMGGGEGGMEHVLEQFGPTLKLPWTKLEAPELTDELRQRLIDGVRNQAAGHSTAELERRRDACLIEIQRVIAKHWPL